jgi:hypothetical protein
MAGTSGGTIVPPRDGDGPPSDEDGLLAQVIPLRQRERGSAEDRLQGPESLDDGFLPPGEAPVAERSVWDQPTGELRRRRPAESDSGHRQMPWANGTGRPASAFSWWLLVVAATGLVVVTVLALALGGALRDEARSVPRATSFIPKTSATKPSHVPADRPAVARSRRAQNTRAAHRPRRRHRELRGPSSAHIVLAPTESTASSGPRPSAREIHSEAPVAASAGSDSQNRPNQRAQKTPAPSSARPSASE